MTPDFYNEILNKKKYVDILSTDGVEYDILAPILHDQFDNLINVPIISRYEIGRINSNINNVDLSINLQIPIQVRKINRKQYKSVIDITFDTTLSDTSNNDIITALQQKLRYYDDQMSTVETKLKYKDDQIKLLANAVSNALAGIKQANALTNSSAGQGLPTDAFVIAFGSPSPYYVFEKGLARSYLGNFNQFKEDSTAYGGVTWDEEKIAKLNEVLAGINVVTTTTTDGDGNTITNVEITPNEDSPIIPEMDAGTQTDTLKNKTAPTAIGSIADLGLSKDIPGILFITAEELSKIQPGPDVTIDFPYPLSTSYLTEREKIY